jgi:hypothetical protein
MEMKPEKIDLEHEIEQLEQQRMKDMNLAMHSYSRVTKVAGFAAFIVFVVMSLSMHSTLLISETNVAAHFLALIINLALVFITYKLVGEFHPLRRRGAEHWNASRKTRFLIDRLKHNT